MTKRIQNIRTTILRSLMVVAMIVCGVGESWGDEYVFMYKNGSTYNFLYNNSNSIGNTNSFNASTCVFVGPTSGSTSGTFQSKSNTSYYLYETQTSSGNFMSTTYTQTLGLSTNSTTYAISGNKVYYNGPSSGGFRTTNSDWYIRFNGTSWETSYSTTTNNEVLYVLTTVPAGLVINDISGNARITKTGDYTYSADAIYRDSYYKFTGASTYYYYNNAMQTAEPAGSSEGITYSYALSSNANGYATVDGNGVITVNSIPSTDTDITLTVTASKSGQTSTSATKTITLSPNNYTSEAIGYVLYSNSYYLYNNNGNVGATNTFAPITCIWTGTLSGTLSNQSKYLNDNNGTLSLGDNGSTTWQSYASESGQTGGKLYTGSRYLQLQNNSTWRTSGQSGNATSCYFAVTKYTYDEESTSPTISGDDTFESTGDKTYTYSAASYKMGYYDYVFYNGAHHYFKTDNSTSLTTAPTAESFTYTWSLSNAGDGHVTIDSSTGAISYSTLYSTDTQGTLTLTAKSTNKTYTITKTITFKSKLPTTLTFASEAPTISGSGIQLPAVTLKDNNGAEMTGTITYSGEGCSVSSTGVVTNITGTSATVTASYAGSTKYAASTATYSITATSHAALNENTCTDIAITPASATLASGTQDYSVPQTVNAETHTQDAYTEYTFPVGTLYKLTDGTLSASAPELKIEKGQTLNFANVQWAFSDGAGNYYNPSTYYSAETNILTLTRGTGLTSTDKTFTITATVTYGTLQKTATATVTIPYTEVDLTAIHLTSTNMTLAVDETAQIQYTYEPNYDAAGKAHVEMDYSVNDGTIVSVDENGVVKGLKEGTTTITMTPKKIDGTLNTALAVTISVEVSNGTGTSDKPFRISSVAGLEKIRSNLSSYFIVSNDFDASSFTTSISGFTGNLDGDFHVISGLSTALFSSLSSGTVKNVILDNVSISGSGNIGAIANEASGSTRIYNCGVLGGTTFDGATGASGSSISGTNAGSIVGYLSGNARVINCYSYANVSGSTWAGGIVGQNATATTQSNLSSAPLIMNCLYYGNITSTAKVSPVYGGSDITNISTSNTTGINTYNYYRNEAQFSLNGKITAYNSTGAIAEDSYLKRFEYYRQILNSNRMLCAYYVKGSVNSTDEIAKWVLDTDVAPYPILKTWGKYPSIVNPDYANASETANAYEGKKLGELTVNITGYGSITMNITDMDSLRYDYTYGKVQLPYYNDYFTDNYQASKVVTGWNITSISGGTAGSFTTSGDDAYNFADRNCTQKDLYSVSGRVFAQGGYFVVPNGVTSITIEPHWGKAVYLADQYYDYEYSETYSNKYYYNAMGSRFSNGSTTTVNGHSVTVYTSLANAMNQLSSGSSYSVYDQAVVLIGNFHSYESWSYGQKPFTLMSADLNNDDEPDYNVYYRQNGEDSGPERWDFITVIGQAMASHTGNNAYAPSVSAFKHIDLGWFEITETSWARFSEFELDRSGRTTSPIILNGGIFDQYESVAGSNSTALQYIMLGGHVYIPLHTPGCHPGQTYSTLHPHITVTGGEYDEFYLSGRRADAATTSSDAYCFANGGYFHVYAGAYMEQINGNVVHKMDHILADEFYGGGVNANKPITGNITTTIDNSYVKYFCGGPKFGDVQSGKTVTTSATGSTFDSFFGGGYGGTSYYEYQADQSTSATTYPSTYFSSKFSSSYLSNTSNGYLTKYKTEHFKYAGGVGTEVVARFFQIFATFSLAKTNDVSSTLTNCTINNNFYGGGSLGNVGGSATSSLTGCTVHGNVFGGGFSATIPTIDVYPSSSTDFTVSTFNQNTGVFTSAKYPTAEKYTWASATSSKAADQSNKLLYTTEDLSKLGQVTGNIILTVKDGQVDGSVYGGGDESGSGGTTTIDIQGTANISGSVYGGGNLANVSGATAVNINGGTVNTAVYGGGALANTGNTTVNLNGGTVNDVYGGGLGSTSVAATVGSTTVNVGSGTVSADVSNHGATNTAGNCKITGSVFGCNNLNGTPTGEATVNVFKTTAKSDDGYHVYAVYGGGNKAAYDPEPYLGTSSTKATHVNIYTCNNSIQYVYGGGNAASVPATNLIVWGGKFDWVFGGGNGAGEGNPGANVGYYTDSDINDVKSHGAEYGSGEASTAVHDGIINHLFGGSNTRGNIRKSSITELNDEGCDFTIGEVYAAGNEAYQDGTAEMHIGCIPGLGVLYGGARKADINNDVQLTITSGTYGQIFGGNNESGSINGSITVNIEETGCNPVVIGEVYGGGNLAPYTVPSGTSGPTVNAYSFTKIGAIYGGGYGETAVVAGNTTVNVQQVAGKHATSIDANGDGSADNNASALGIIGTVYGGGNAAKVDGNTNVNIGTAKEVTFLSSDADDGSWSATKTVLGANIQPVEVTIPANITGGEEKTYTGNGNIFGGGNNAEVTGKTNVVIGADKQ